MKVKAKTLKRLLNIWPPFWGAGLKVLTISEDYSYAKVALHLRWYTRNYIGTQYGGSLFSMTDPFYMLMLINRLGSQYIVWDQAAEIHYKSPGKTHVFAEVHITEDDIARIKQQTANGEKYLPQFDIRIFDKNNQTVATVKRTLYIKLKAKHRKTAS